MRISLNPKPISLTKTNRIMQRIFKACAILAVSQCLILVSALAQAQDLPKQESFGDWVVGCGAQQNAEGSCVMSQLAIVQSTKERLLRLDISYLPSSDSVQARFILPLGVNLNYSPQIFLDGRLEHTFKYDICLEDGCYSTFKLKPSLLEKFLRMQGGELKLEAGNGKPMTLPISGAGSRKAFNAAKELAISFANP